MVSGDERVRCTGVGCFRLTPKLCRRVRQSKNEGSRLSGRHVGMPRELGRQQRLVLRLFASAYWCVMLLARQGSEDTLCCGYTILVALCTLDGWMPERNLG